jgi:hypothetical protein
MNAVNTLFETLCGMGWISPAYRPLPVIYIFLALYGFQGLFDKSGK